MATQNQNQGSPGGQSDPGRDREAGNKGGQSPGGNFANDPDRAREAGKKGGEQSHGGASTQGGSSQGSNPR